MNTSVTLTAEEFKQIHNALCFAHSDGIQKTVETIREALAGAYAQDESAFEGKYAYYNDFRCENRLDAIWSIYELGINGFLQKHPWQGATVLVYQGVTVKIKGDTWADLYRAADEIIYRSGDDHHIFIESFELANGDELHLGTGS